MQSMEIRQEHQRRSGDLTRKRNENSLLRRQMAEQERRILECAETLGVVRQATEFLEGVANSRRGAMKHRIEDVVTEAVRLIYGTDYRVELIYGVKNNRSSLEIEMVRDIPEGEVRREIGGYGGGMADTISVPLRLLVLLGSKQAARLCVLDECWKHMDNERIENVAEFLRVLIERLGMQVFFFTHHELIRDRADKVFIVSETNGRSMVKT